MSTQKQANMRTRFLFTFYGVFSPELWREKLDLQSAIISQDNRGLKYAFIKTKAKRVSEIKSHLNRHDSDAPDAMKVKLTTIAGYESIISFEKGEDPTKHSIYKTMMKYVKSASAVKWESGQDSFRKYQQQLSDGGGDGKGDTLVSSAGNDLINDESSRDSVDSAAELIATLPPESKQIVDALMKVYNKGLAKMGKEFQQKIQEVREDIKTHAVDIRGTKANTAKLLEVQETSSEEFNGMLRGIGATQEILVSKQAEIHENVQDIAAGQEIMAASVVAQEVKIDRVAAAQVEASFFRRDLERTADELAEERKKKRSAAGKLAAKTRIVNKALAQQARMAADQLTMIERSAVITEVRHVQNMMDSVASQLGMSVETPFGDLDCKGAYESWLEQNGYDEHYQEYKVNLETTYRKATEMIRRDDLSPAPEFPEIAKIRLFMYGMAVLFKSMDDRCNLDNSPAKQRLDLAIYSCNILSRDTLDEIRDVLETHVKFFSDLLSIEYVKDTTVYPSIQGDAFEVPVVSVFQSYLVFWCLKLIFFSDEIMETGTNYFQPSVQGILEAFPKEISRIFSQNMLALFHFPALGWSRCSSNP